MASLLTPEQRKLLRSISNYISGDLFEAPPEIETQLPGIDSLTEYGINAGLGYGQGELGQARQSALMQLLSGESGYTSMTPEQIAAQTKARFYDPAMRQFSTEIVPEIESNFGGSEAWRTGDISRAIGDAVEGVGIGGMAQSAALTESEWARQFEAEQNAQNRMLAGVPLSSEEEKTPIRFGLMAGDIRRGINLEQANFDLMKELRNTPYANPAWGVAPLVLGTSAKAPSVGGGGSDSTGMLGGILGLLLGGSGLGSIGTAIGGMF